METKEQMGKIAAAENMRGVIKNQLENRTLEPGEEVDVPGYEGYFVTTDRQEEGCMFIDSLKLNDQTVLIYQRTGSKS